MRAATPLIVEHAELVGSSGVMEDRLFIGQKSVIVLDGATQANRDTEQTGGWIAEQIGSRFSALIDQHADNVALSELLAQAIADTRDRFSLVPGSSPTTTVSVARFTDQTVDLLVLGDSPALSRVAASSAVEVLVDQSLGETIKDLKKPTSELSDSKEWRDFYDAIAQRRNKPNGFWIAEAEPMAALHAKTQTLPPSASAILCTDGASAIVDKYKLMNWQEFFEAAQAPHSLLERVQSIESNDPQRIAYPRSKASDDKLLASATRFAAPPHRVFGRLPDV